MLLLTGVDLVACELLAPDACELAQSGASSTAGCDDACLCCCCHVDVSVAVRLEPAAETVALDLSPEPRCSSFELDRIFHPPQA